MNTGPLSPIQASIRKFEDIEPQWSEGMHASTLRDEHGKRYAVFAEKDKVWPVYIYVFDEARWYGMCGNSAMIGHVKTMVVHLCPVPTNMVRWQCPLVMSDIHHFGLAGAVQRRVERAAKGHKV